MIGTREAQPIGQVMPNLFRTITIRISEPMRFDRYTARASDPKVLRQVTDEIMFELRELSGQEYVDSYAVRKGGVAVAEPAHVVTAAEILGQAEPPLVAAGA
jgi:1-acyl-sn-glycerol-3-phosphate acyltransferase